MGCGASQKDVVGPIRLSTVTGRLKVTVTTAHLDYDASVFKMDPYIILKLSNQVFQTKVAVKGDKTPSYMETFQFFVNSCYKAHGRNLEMLMMDKKKIGSDNQIGFGIVDLDPVINFKKPKQQFRCFLSHDRKNAGFIHIITEFVEQPSELLSFRFETASIRRKIGFGDMECRVRVTIGEQILLTSLQKDTKQAPPIWKEEILTFNLTKSIKECEIDVLNVNDLIGNTKMSIEELMDSKDEKNYNEQFQFEDRVNAGSIKFSTKVGENPVFSEIKSVIKKKIPEAKKQQPQNQTKKQNPELNNQNKNQEKKEDKKQQPKQEKVSEQSKPENSK